MAKRRISKRKQLLIDLQRRIRAMGEAELAEYSNGYIQNADGHTLSATNTRLIMMQCVFGGHPVPAMVGGYKQWQRYGRQVRGGERSYLAIYVPMQIKTGDVDTDGAEDTETRFFAAAVWDIRQTEPVEALVREGV